MAEKIYSIADIMYILGISKGAAYKLIHSGELKYFRIGRSIRITESALNDYILAHSNTEGK